MKQNLLPALKLTLICLVFFSGIYTMILLGIAKFTPNGGNAESVDHAGNKQYANLAQSFTDDGYFWSRPSAVGYNTAGSAGSNKGPTNADYLAAVEARIDTFLAHNPGVRKAELPSELVTASGSGLDPHVTVRGTTVQVKRVAKARGMSEADVRKVIEDHTHGPLLGLFGTTTINVLELNMALDAATK